MATRLPSTRRPAVRVLAVVLVLAILLGGYAVAMHLTVDISKLEHGRTPSQRDEIYAIIHVAVLAATLILGFALGRWLTGNGLAYAALIGSIVAVGMVLAMVGSHELACQGHNDLLRHWTC